MPTVVLLVPLLLSLAGEVQDSLPPVRLTPRTTISGRTYTEQPVHVFHYEGLAGERLVAKATRVPWRDFSQSLLIDKVKLRPYLEVARSDTGEVLAASESPGKRTRVAVELPVTGLYEIRVSGWSGTEGSYKLKVTGRWPKRAQEAAIDVRPDGITFPGRPGVQLDVALALAGDVKNGMPMLTLVGPTGEVDLAPFLWSKSAKKAKPARVGVDGVRFAVAGTYELTWEGEPELLRLRLRTRRSPRTRLVLHEMSWPGRWIGQDLPAGHRSELTLSAASGVDGTTWITENDKYVLTVTADDWWVDPLYISDQQSGGILKLEMIEVVTEWKGPSEGFFFSTWWHLDVEPGVPDAFVVGSRAYLRDLTDAGAAPVPTMVTTPDAGVAFIWAHTPKHRRYEVFRAPDGTEEVPGIAHTVVLPLRPKRPTMTWIDPSGESGDVYWLRAWTNHGPSLVGGPWRAP